MSTDFQSTLNSMISGAGLLFSLFHLNEFSIINMFTFFLRRCWGDLHFCLCTVRCFESTLTSPRATWS